MLKPDEHKSVQSRILKYAEEIGWTFVSQGEAERRRGFDSAVASPRERAANASRFFTDTAFDKEAFACHSNWNDSEKELRGLRQSVYFGLLAEDDDMDNAAKLVEETFNHLFKVYNL